MAVTSPPTSTSVDDTEFDYVIVGSGAGGAPLAARLAEQGHRVLVLEAGPDHRAGAETSEAREVTEVPAFHAPSNEHRDVSWRFFVKHYNNNGERDKKWSDEFGGIYYPRATGVGGCTVHNAMITIAGPAADWDELAFFLNDPSWKSDVMRGYFQERVERCEYFPPRRRSRGFLRGAADTFWWLIGRDADPTVGRHGFDGWLRTSILSIQNLKRGLRDRQLIKMLKAAAVTSAQAGLETPWLFARRVFLGEIKEPLDPNHFRRQTDRPEGLALIPTAVYADKGKGNNTKGECGHRSGPARRLLEVASQHPDLLVIATDCLATKVILEARNGGGYRATGVEYLHGPRLYRAAKCRADLRLVRVVPHGQAACGRRCDERTPLRARRAADRDCHRAQRPRVLRACGARHQGSPRPAGVSESRRRRTTPSEHAGTALQTVVGAGSAARVTSDLPVFQRRGERAVFARRRRAAAKRRQRSRGVSHRHPLRARLSSFFQTLRRALRGFRR